MFKVFLLSLLLTPAHSQDLVDSFQFNGTEYAFDVERGHFQGSMQGTAEKCGLVIKEGEDLILIYQKGPYHDLLVPEAILIDSFLKLQSLVFALDVSVGKEGTGGVMSLHEKITSQSQLSSDFLRANNRTLFAVLPQQDKKEAVKVFKGPGLCGSTTSYNSLPKVQVEDKGDELILRLQCGGSETAQEVLWQVNFARDPQKRYLFAPTQLQYRVSLGEAVDGSGFYRSTQNKKDLIHLQCEGMKKIAPF